MKSEKEKKKKKKGKKLRKQGGKRNERYLARK
jgi:hypothetical protein